MLLKKWEELNAITITWELVFGKLMGPKADPGIQWFVS